MQRSRLGQRLLPSGFLRTALVVSFVAAVGVMLFVLYRSGLLSRLPAMIRASGSFGIAISYAAIVIQTFVPFAPFALLAGCNALVHGFWLGYVSTWAGAFSGALLMYALSRKAWDGPLARLLDRFMARHPRVQRFRQRIERKQGWSVFGVILLLRLQPWLPSSAIDIAAGMARVRMGPFVIATVVGQAPMIALESYVGNRILDPQGIHRGVWLVAGALFVVLSGYVIWRARLQKT